MLNGSPETLKNHSRGITSEPVQLSDFPLIKNIWNMLGADFEKKNVIQSLKDHTAQINQVYFSFL